MRHMLLGVRPACLGMVLGVLVSLSLRTFLPDGSLQLRSVLIAAVDLVLLLKFKAGIPKILLFSAGMGLMLYGLPGIM